MANAGNRERHTEGIYFWSLVRPINKSCDNNPCINPNEPGQWPRRRSVGGVCVYLDCILAAAFGRKSISQHMKAIFTSGLIR